MYSVLDTAPDWFWALATLPYAFLWSCVLGVLLVQGRKYLCHRHDLAFKRDLIERGYEPDEIPFPALERGGSDGMKLKL